MQIENSWEIEIYCNTEPNSLKWLSEFWALLWESIQRVRKKKSKFSLSDFILRVFIYLGAQKQIIMIEMAPTRTLKATVILGD